MMGMYGPKKEESTGDCTCIMTNFISYTFHFRSRCLLLLLLLLLLNYGYEVNKNTRFNVKIVKGETT